MLRFCAACKTAGFEAKALSQDVVRKGFYDYVNSATRRKIYQTLEKDWPELIVAIRADIRAQMESEFSAVIAPEHGGENLSTNARVKLPGFEQPGKIDSIEGDVVFCFEPRSTYSSRPFFRAHLEKADPASASAANGQEGGRPRGPTATEMANAFLASPGVSVEGVCAFRFHRGQWFQYNGRFYESVQEQDIKGSVMEFLRQHPVFSALATSKALADLMNQLRAHDAAGIPSTFEAPLRIIDDGFESAPGWCATRSGLVNFVNLARAINGENLPEDQLVQPLTARLFSTMALDYEFNLDSKCPRFEAFLNEVLPDQETREMVQMMAGLCLVPDTRFNVFFVLYGPAGTGKSTLLGVLYEVIGPRNVCHVPFSKFGDKFSVGLLTEHLVNLIGEGDTELPKDVGLGRVEGLLKDISDGGILPVERKFQEPGKARATARCILATNSLPTFYDKSEAIWDRMRVLPFEVRIRGTGRENPSLRQEIVESELPGILNWALHGLAKLRMLKRFPECPRGTELKETHRAQCDHEREFLTEMYGEGGADDAIKTQDVYFLYQAWMKKRNYYPVSEGRFARNVERVMPKVRRGRKRDAAGKQVHVWLGLCPSQEAA
jgi:P4 family phage/plasmid primase-like protien